MKRKTRVSKRNHDQSLDNAFTSSEKQVESINSSSKTKVNNFDKFYESFRQANGESSGGKVKTQQNTPRQLLDKQGEEGADEEQAEVHEPEETQQSPKMVFVKSSRSQLMSGNNTN